MKRLMIALLCLMMSASAMAFEVGDIVTPKEGPESGIEGRVIAIYNHDGQESFGVEFDKVTFGLYKKEDLKRFESGIFPITDIKNED